MIRHVRAYTVSVVAAAAAFLISHAVSPAIEPIRSPLFLAAIVVAAWYGGLGPGLLAAAMAAVAKMYFVLPPTALAIPEAADLLYLAVFVSVAVLVSTLTGALRRADALNRALVVKEQAARGDAEAAHRAKDVFLAKVSHELRTSLQATSSWAHLLDRVRHDDRLFVKTLGALHRCIGAQAILIDDLLAASQVIAGKMRLSFEVVRLGPVVEAAVATAETVARLPQPAIHVAVDPFAGPVRADRVRLEQIVCNLVSNALKFTPPEGRVDVRVESEGQNVTIIVADTGCGVPKEMVSRLFDEFWQAPTGQLGSGAGLGLGLAIVRQLVHMHGGTIHAESAGVGFGATFTVELPLHREDVDTSTVAGRGDAIARTLQASENDRQW